MLKLLVRIAAFGVAIFMAVLAGLFLSSQEQSFPWATSYTAHLDFSHATTEKQKVITDLSGLADSSGLRIAKVVGDPKNFMTSRSLYIFGEKAPHHATNIEWFRPGMQGQLRDATFLGDAPLSGTYVYSGSPEAVKQFVQWLNESAIPHKVHSNTAAMVLAGALLTTGAWLPLMTCLVLLISLTISWYVLRSKSRSLKVLNGASAVKIVVDDFVSLLKTTAIPIVAGFLLSVGFVFFSGRVSWLVTFAVTTFVFLAASFTVMFLAAALVGAITWPSVKGIASRLPPERHFRGVGEALKAAALILVAISLPAAGSAIAIATNLSDQGARWQSLSGQLSVRLHAETVEEFDAQMPNMEALVVAADKAEMLTFSYAMGDRQIDGLAAAGYDGFVMVNPHYLEKISSFMGFRPTALQPLGSQGTAVAPEALPSELRADLLESFDVWNRADRRTNGRDNNFSTYRYTGTKTFPGLDPIKGAMSNFTNPLIAVIDRPSTTFNTNFLTATLSSGNQIFNDSAWLHNYLAHSPLEAIVLSTDRVSDSGLSVSQEQGQVASVQMLSYALAILALVASIAVSAWIYALARGRRHFAQRTSGWTWKRVLVKRIAWESLLAIVLTGLILLGVSGAAAESRSSSSSDSNVWWVLIAIPLYVAVSAAMHLAAVRKVFALRIKRSD